VHAPSRAGPAIVLQRSVIANIVRDPRRAPRWTAVMLGERVSDAIDSE
jgi:hypothetical protein